MSQTRKEFQRLIHNPSSTVSDFIKLAFTSGDKQRIIELNHICWGLEVYLEPPTISAFVQIEDNIVVKTPSKYINFRVYLKALQIHRQLGLFQIKYFLLEYLEF